MYVAVCPSVALSVSYAESVLGVRVRATRRRTVHVSLVRIVG